MPRYTCQTHNQHVDIDPITKTRTYTSDMTPSPICEIRTTQDPVAGTYAKALRGLNGAPRTNTCVIIQEA
jgi:hypothetical protein